MRTENYLHNPFQNRFNVPVTQRLDEMQAVTNMVWLHEPAVVNSNAHTAHSDRPADADNRSRRVNLRPLGLLSLLLIVLIAVVALVSAL